MKKYLLTVIVLIVASISLVAQTVSNVEARTEGNNVYVSYDLSAPVEGQKFTIELRSSINNYTTVLKDVTGDVGPDQDPGIGKTIVWNAIK